MRRYFEAKSPSIEVRRLMDTVDGYDPVVWQQMASELGLQDRLHLWPDKSLGSQKFLRSLPDSAAYVAWLERSWNRISEWPTTTTTEEKQNE